MPESKTPWEQAAEWFARTLAIVLVMVAPGAFGAWLDGRLGTTFIAAIGFVLGMVLAIAMLMIFVRIKPIHNDGDFTKLRSMSETRSSATSSTSKPSPISTRSTELQPSESRLPDVPAAEVLESPRDE